MDRLDREFPLSGEEFPLSGEEFPLSGEEFPLSGSPPPAQSQPPQTATSDLDEMASGVELLARAISHRKSPLGSIIHTDGSRVKAQCDSQNGVLITCSQNRQGMIGFATVANV